MVDKPDITPPPSVTDLDSAVIGDDKVIGKVDPHTDYGEPKDPGDGKGIVDAKPTDPDAIVSFVEVDAKFPATGKLSRKEFKMPMCPWRTRRPQGTTQW